MIIDVAFRYNAAVLGRKRRNPWNRVYLGSVPVELAEVTSEQAPVALRYRNSSRSDYGPKAEMDIRLHGDRLFRPVYDVKENRHDDTPAVVTPRRAADVVACAEKGYEQNDGYGSLLPVGSRNYQETGIGAIEADREIAKVVSSAKEKREIEIRDAVADYLVVDGRLYEACPEPVYLVKHYHDRREGGYSRWITVEFEGNDRQSPAETFRADELDHMREVKRLKGDADDQLIEVLIPEAVRFDGPDRALLQAAEAVRDHLKANIAVRDEDYFRTFMRLRDAVAAVPVPEGGRVDASDLAGILADTLASLPASNDYWHVKAEDALKRYDVRSLSTDLSLTP